MHTHPQSLHCSKRRGDQNKHPVLKRKLAVYLNKEYIILGDFKLHHEAWEGLQISKTLIEK